MKRGCVCVCVCVCMREREIEREWYVCVCVCVCACVCVCLGAELTPILQSTLWTWRQDVSPMPRCKGELLMCRTKTHGAGGTLNVSHKDPRCKGELLMCRTKANSSLTCT